jgi:RNA polymerase sigma factor (sigma-70 family)
MATLDDMQLLRQYATSRSEAAFATLVSRNINLVYSAALRQVRNPHQAEEIAQAVFVILAKKSRALRPAVVLSGWLYNTARLVSANFLRGEFRRQRREQQAYMQSSLNDPQPPSWQRIAPLLDEAMARLNEKDRNAVVLRYFEGRDIGAIAAALGSSEGAAKMRLSRALEKLRQFFLKRGIPISGAGLATVISEFSVQAAPASLAASVTSAVCGGSALAASTLTLVKGTLTMIAWTKISIGIATVAVAAIACQWYELSDTRQKTAQLQQQLARQTELFNDQQDALKQLQNRNTSLAQQVQSLSRPPATASDRADIPPATPATPPSAPKGGLLASMLKDPAMKQAMIDQQAMLLKKQYAALVKQLNLTPEKTDKFYSILIDVQSNNMANSLAMFSASGDKAAADKAISDSVAAADTQVQALLGDNAFAQFKDYRESLVDRMQLDQMTSDFSASPLSGDQYQKLLQTMRAERENAAPVPGQPAAQSDMAANMNTVVDRQQQINDRVLQQAESFLSPQQLQTLAASQSNFLRLEKSYVPMMQNMMGPSPTNPSP